MTTHNQKAIELASIDRVFAQIFMASNPQDVLRELETQSWLEITGHMTGCKWIVAALDAKQGKDKAPTAYSLDPDEVREVEMVLNHYRRFEKYSTLLISSGAKPLTDYLVGITPMDLRDLLRNLRGMDAAREIQRLYKEGAIDDDLGGSQLHRYLKSLGLKYIPTINHLNAARRGEISKGRYNMAKSRKQNEKLL